MASAPHEFPIPKSVLALKNYSLSKFLGDLVAGITVGLVALPLAMAFAISSGVPPEAGLYCAVVAGFLISALGGSMTQIGGPTGAFVVVVAGIVQKHGIDGLFMTTMMAGVLMILLGVTGLGVAVKYIPRPVVIGFTNGIAVLIASTQIKDFFGLKIEKVPGEFLGRMEAIVHHWSTLDWTTTGLSTASLLLIVLLMRVNRKIPGTIVALAFGTLAAFLLHLPVETIATRFGGIPAGLPELRLPSFRADLILPLLSPVLTVTMLGAIESLLSAVVADRMSGDTHNPNMELIAQGVANVASPLFGGLPATGAIARTATNVRSGAKTPVAGMLHAITLLIVLLVATPVAKQIPLAVLAAILFIVAYNMGEWAEIPVIWNLGKKERWVWLITFLLTVFADLTVAVEAGMILAVLLYIQRVTMTTTVEVVTKEYVEEGQSHSLQAHDIPEGVVIFRIHGPFMFGSTDKLSVIEEDMDYLPPVVLLRLRNMNAIDGTGVHALENLAKRLKEKGKHLIICGLREQPAKLIHMSSLDRLVGPNNIHHSLTAAINRAEEILANEAPVAQ